MASQITSAVLLAACFAVLIMVCAAVGEGQRPVPRNMQGVRPVNEIKALKGLKVTEGMRPIHKNMKVTEGMRPIHKNMKVTEGMRPIPKVVTQMAPKLDMPPMPGATPALGMRPIHKNMKVTKGMRPIPKVVTEMAAPKLDMPPMPGMPPMPDMAPTPSPNSSSFTYPSLVVGFLALVAVFCA